MTEKWIAGTRMHPVPAPETGKGRCAGLRDLIEGHKGRNKQ